MGGLIGRLVVDPLTGAMYNLSSECVHPDFSESVGIETWGAMIHHPSDDMSRLYRPNGACIHEEWRSLHVVRYISILLLCVATLPLHREGNPHLAIMPFDANNVAPSDADTITNLFETAMVQTGQYSIIEHRQVDAILGAQEYSPSGLTTETGATEVGNLLSAEQILMGEIGKVQDDYVLTTKIVDVETGQNLKADSVEGDSLGHIKERLPALAERLAPDSKGSDIADGSLLSSEADGEKAATSQRSPYLNLIVPGISHLSDGQRIGWVYL